jgi:methionyl-tRNA synthetase
VVAVLLAPWLPETTQRLLGALGRPALALHDARLGAATPERVGALDPLFPKQP